MATLYVTAQQKNQLAKGLLAIVQLDDKFAIVPAAVADKIKTRDQTVVVSQHERPSAKNTDQNDVDDPYADFQIPDDFDW